MIKQISQAIFCVAVLVLAWVNGAEDGPKLLLGPGDSIHITVYRNLELTLDVRVNGDGAITFPLLGSVHVGGLTVNEAEERIAKGLKEGGFMQQPHVNIAVVVTRANSVSILGQVNRPGLYPIEVVNLRLSEALALAGGVASSAGVTGGITTVDKVILKGTRDGRYFLTEVDLSSIYSGNKPENDLIVYPRDEIFVPPAPLFYIYGEVQRPGSYTVARDMTVMQALAQGGGLTPRGTERNIQLQRRQPDGHTEKISAELTDIVQANDVVYVHESLF